MMSTNGRLGLAASCGLAALVAGLAVADGIPTITPLTYSGVLQNSAGAPVTGQQSMQLTLWDDATANASANQKCVTPTQNVTPDSQGRFQIVLDQACFDAVRASPNLWVQLQIGSAVLPRSKLGAVPYAVESGKASRVVVNAGGSARTTVDGVYCGATPNQTGAWSASAGSLVGYAAGKRLCEQACSSSTAHACSGLELARHLSLGGPALVAGWIVTGNASSFPGYPNGSWDCSGFRDGTANSVGTSFAVQYPQANSCITNQPILCCD
jgi:hypothetical protein